MCKEWSATVVVMSKPFIFSLWFQSIFQDILISEDPPINSDGNIKT